MDAVRAKLSIALALLGAALPTACELSNESPRRAAAATITRSSAPARPTPRIVDSTRSLEEDLRRFRADIPVAPTRLTGGAATRESLVRRFLDALSRSDTAALAGMALARAEFAYLVYPSSPYTRAPYRQSPEIAWLLLRAEHDKGFVRLLGRLGGQRINYLGHRCDPTPLREGTNRLWRNCRVRVRIAGDSVRERRLFGVIVERAGHYKFAAYNTDF